MYRIKIGSSVIYTSEKGVNIIDKMVLEQAMQKYNTDTSALPGNGEDIVRTTDNEINSRNVEIKSFTD